MKAFHISLGCVTSLSIGELTSVDAGPALVDAGFLVGSEKRRRLYADGKFRPRETLVLWRRRDMLTWASSCTGPNEAARPRSVSPSSVRATPPRCPTNNITDHRRKLQNGRATLIDCKRLLFYNPRHYVVAILFLPALFFAILAGALLDGGRRSPCIYFHHLRYVDVPIFLFAVNFAHVVAK